MESEGERRDRQIVEMRTSGKSEAEVARLLNCSKADVRLVVDAEAVATLSAANRVRMIYLESQRLDELQEVFTSRPRPATSPAARWSSSSWSVGRRLSA